MNDDIVTRASETTLTAAEEMILRGLLRRGDLAYRQAEKLVAKAEKRARGPERG